MPRLLIQAGLKGFQKYELPRGEVRIGRGDEVEVRLPNVSVSRYHCTIRTDSQGASITDEGSSNGTQVNKKSISDTTVLRSGDELLIGKFHLVYLGDLKADRFYRGRFTEYLPDYTPTEKGGDADSTFAMTKEALKALAEQDDVIDNARFILNRDPSRFWYPEDRRLSFGGDAALVEVEGWFCWGEIAEVTYGGGRHIVNPLTTWRGGVEVNGEKLKGKRGMKDGDRVVIGKSAFRYVIS
ncbi:MAG: FHA domain-containing protein [Proteobacteria bacterium]|nr:FHA domain-containing protein [Pseudomonadota bacterium]MCP4921747.1 FHA domain-containing protein [Pseudomonadota bacterium]